MSSIIQRWVEDLPLRMQAMMLCAIRGCDGISKFDPSKRVLRYLRACILNPADPNWEENDPDGFMGVQPTLVETKFMFQDMDQYPLHFFMHLLHAAECLAFYYPDMPGRHYWLNFYKLGVAKLHLAPETQLDFDKRLS